MCLSLREIPDISEAQCVNLVFPVLVDSRDKNSSLVHDAPFGHSVPMKFTNRTLLEMLLSGSDIVRLRQVLNYLFAHPTTVEDLGLRIGKSPLQVWDSAGVGVLFSKLRRVGHIDLMIGAAWSASVSEKEKCIRPSKKKMLSINMKLALSGHIPKVPPPLPLASMGWPFLNCPPSRGVSTAPSVAEARKTRARPDSFIVQERKDNLCRDCQDCNDEAVLK